MALHTIEVARKEIAKIYIAAFNRVPDAGGLSNWMNQYMAGLMTYKQIAADFANQPEYTAKYPSIMTDSEYITQIYLNVFGRTPDAGGLQNWINQIANPAVSGITRGSVMQEMLLSAAAPGNSDGVRLANQADFGVQSILDGVPTATATAQLANITADAATVTAATAAVAGEAGNALGQTIAMTKGLDNVIGTENNDVIIGSISTSADLNTVSAIDIVNGGAGIDTLKIADETGTIVVPNLSNVEVIEVSGAAGVIVDTTATTGVTNLNIIKAANAINADAGSSTDVSANLKAAGAAVDVDGGKNVAVTLTDVASAANVVTIGTDTDGGGAADLGVAAAGTVTVSMTGAAYTATTADTTLSAVTVTGGTKITVNQTAASSTTAAATDTDTKTITQGAITVVGDSNTTEVVVAQSAYVAEVDGKTAVTGTETTQAITFGAMAAGETYSLDFGTGTLTFTAKKALTAAEAASAFANLTAGDVQGDASATLGLYTNALNTSADLWTSGAAVKVTDSAYKVTFSSTSTTATAITNNASTAALTVGAKTNGTDAVTAVTGVMGVNTGVVKVDDAATNVIKTITIDGYANTSRIGTSGDTTVLETLTLKNAQTTASMTVDDTAATLALTVEKLGLSTGDAVLTFSAAPTTLNVTSTGANYINLTAAATETLSVSGTGLLDIDTTDLAALKTVTVSGTAGLKLNAGVDNTVTSVDTTATTGAVTVSIQGDKATYTGGAGVDTVSVTNASTAISKAIDLGAGDDTLNLSATLAIDPTAELKGGEGMDTLVLSAAAAVARTGGVTFQDKVTSFEKLKVGSLAVASTVNLDNLDDINYVISSGAAGTVAVYTIDLAGATVDNAGDMLTFSNGGALGTYTAAGVENAAAIRTAMVTTGTISIGGVTYNVTAGSNATTVVLTATTATTLSANMVVAAVDSSAGATATESAPTGTPYTITTSGVAAAAAVLTLDDMLTNATVELLAAGDVVVGLKDDTPTTDKLNLVTNALNGVTIGTVTADEIETIAISVTDTDTTVAGISTNTLTLDADTAGTVNVAGAGKLVLNLSASTTEVTLIDASTMTGAFTVQTVASDTAATTVKGGTAGDTITLAGANDVALGGDGADTLKVTGGVASAVTLTGGAGDDSFDVSGFTAANAGAAVTITDLVAGETIKFKVLATSNFASSKVTLIAESTFTEYVTEAAAKAELDADSLDGNATDNDGQGGMAWFQFNNNTFIVQDVDGNGAFTDGTDIIVKITGTLDLSNSSFNVGTAGTFEYIA